MAADLCERGAMEENSCGLSRHGEDQASIRSRESAHKAASSHISSVPSAHRAVEW